MNGFGADCRCHRNSLDLAGTTHCKKNLPKRSRDPETEGELRRLAKVWLLVGLEMEESDDIRSAHVAVNPRMHYIGVPESQLDDIAATL